MVPLEVVPPYSEVTVEGPSFLASEREVSTLWNTIHEKIKGKGKWQGKGNGQSPLPKTRAPRWEGPAQCSRPLSTRWSLAGGRAVAATGTMPAASPPLFSRYCLRTLRVVVLLWIVARPIDVRDAAGE